MDEALSRRDVIKLTGAAALLAATDAVAGPAAGGGDEPAKATGPAAMLPGAFAGGEYTLPPLPYAKEALEPLYEARTLEIHHGKHHAAYVKGLNKALAKLADARKAGDFEQVKALSRDVAFNASGHVLHTLFWHSMTPGGSEAPASLQAAINDSFGSLDAAKAQFAAAARDVEASGWAVLAYEPVGKKLLILQAEKHQDLAVWGVAPLLVCDVWEHAYYLQFANERGKWVDNFMKLANWQFAAERLDVAKAGG